MQGQQSNKTACAFHVDRSRLFIVKRQSKGRKETTKGYVMVVVVVVVVTCKTIWSVPWCLRLRRLIFSPIGSAMFH